MTSRESEQPTTPKGEPPTREVESDDLTTDRCDEISADLDLRIFDPPRIASAWEGSGSTM